jgi:hypothetical protein
MLTTSQRAIAAAEAWPLYGGKPRNQWPGGERPTITRAKMARLFEVSETYMVLHPPAASRARS